jgi:hypothetical protein
MQQAAALALPSANKLGLQCNELPSANLLVVTSPKPHKNPNQGSFVNLSPGVGSSSSPTYAFLAMARVCTPAQERGLLSVSSIFVAFG